MVLERVRRGQSSCQLIGTNEDGSKKWVCQVDESKVFEVVTDKNGEIKIPGHKDDKGIGFKV